MIYIDQEIIDRLATQFNLKTCAVGSIVLRDNQSAKITHKSNNGTSFFVLRMTDRIPFNVDELILDATYIVDEAEVVKFTIMGDNDLPVILVVQGQRN